MGSEQHGTPRVPHRCDRLCQALTEHAQGLVWGVTSMGEENTLISGRGLHLGFPLVGDPPEPRTEFILASVFGP